MLLLIGWGDNKRQYSQAREKVVIIKSLQNALTDQNSHVQPIRAATLISTNYWARDLDYARFPAIATTNIFPNPLPNQQYITPNGKIKTNLLQLVLDSSGSQQKQIL